MSFQVIHKIQVHLFLKETHEVLPVGTKVRHFAIQNGNLYVWVEKSLGVEQKSLFRFFIKATGEEFESGPVYIGTVHAFDGTVWHAFYTEQPE